MSILEHSPAAAEWQYGPLPPVETVPYDQCVILWSPEYIGAVRPWGNALNPLRWGDSSGFPQWGSGSPTGWWTILREGSKPRPPQIQTWPQFEAKLQYVIPESATCCACGFVWKVAPFQDGTGFLHPDGSPEMLTFTPGQIVDWGLAGKCPQCGKIQEIPHG